MTDLAQNGKIARGVGWMLLFKLVERSLGILSTLVLVRLLAPADFGVVAMAQSVIVMVQLLAAFGFDVALIHDRSATADHYHTAWTLNACLGGSITLIVLSLAAPIAHFYSRPELFWVVCALAPCSLFAGLENIGMVAFRKELRFRSEFAFQVSRKLVAFSVTLPLAFAFRSYWALVIGTLVSALSSAVLSYLVHPFRPRPRLSRAGELLHFSRWLLVGNVVAFIKERASDFFIGRMAGAASLGAYNVSYEISNLPTTELSAPINRALLPGLSSLAADPPALRHTYLQAFGLLAMLAAPAAVGIFALADFLVPVLLGDKWLEAVPLIRILAISGLMLTLQSSVATVLIATGHPKSPSVASGVYVAVLIVGLATLVPQYGATGAAASTLAAALVTTPVFLLHLRRYARVPLVELLHRAWRPAAGAVVMLAAVHWTLPAHAPDMSVFSAIAWLAVGALVAAATYPALIFGLWVLAGRPDGAERIALGRIQAVAGRHFARRRGSPDR